MGPLWGEFTGHRWIPLTKASDAELWRFLWSALEQTVEQTVKLWVIIGFDLFELSFSLDWSLTVFTGKYIRSGINDHGLNAYALLYERVYVY